MRVVFAAVVLVGCAQGVGEIAISGAEEADPGFVDPRSEGGTTVAPGVDNPGGDAPVDENEGPALCGPETHLRPEHSGSHWRHFVGSTTLERTSSDAWDWKWTGCEAERYFDDQGELLCERVWHLSGPIIDALPGDPEYVYSLAFKADSMSTCAETVDQDWVYGFDVQADELDLFYRSPEVGDWNFWSGTVFRENPNSTVVKFDYSTEFFPVEDPPVD